MFINRNQEPSTRQNLNLEVFLLNALVLTAISKAQDEFFFLLPAWGTGEVIQLDVRLNGGKQLPFCEPNSMPVKKFNGLLKILKFFIFDLTA